MRETGRRADALLDHRKALAIRERLAAEFPAEAKFQFDLAGSHHNLGRLLQQTGQLHAVLASYRMALSIRGRGIRSRPDEVQMLNQAAGYNALGGLQRQLGQRADALASHREALAIRERLAAAQPSSLEYQHDLSESCYSIGYLLHAMSPRVARPWTTIAGPSPSASGSPARIRTSSATGSIWPRA